jgi:Crp-like helix-turn-helix protein
LRPGSFRVFRQPLPGISYNFLCEAITDCQVGTIDLKSFIEIPLGITLEDFKRMVVGCRDRWDLVQLRCANFMSCTLEERLALILLELSDNFGFNEKRGTHLTVPARHKDLADLVGASRPRVTEFLIQFERDHFVIRDERHLIIRRDRLENFLAETQSRAAKKPIFPLGSIWRHRARRLVHH